jgi:hypothetical protein
MESNAYGVKNWYVCWAKESNTCSVIDLVQHLVQLVGTKSIFGCEWSRRTIISRVADLTAGNF